jgi:TatD DNase family protein
VFDSHCHLDQPTFDGDRREVAARAAAAGVRGLLIPGIGPAMWGRQVLAQMTAEAAGLRVVQAIGVHPQLVPELRADERALAQAPDRIAEAVVRFGAVAVGECGLDGGTGELALQEAIFRAQIRAARGLRLPLVLHVLRAHDQALAILRQERVQDVGGILHSYSGGAALVPVYAKLGLAFSFAGPVTYPNARRPLEAARAVPDDLLLAETDAPDQAPAGHRGGRSEPAFVVDVIAGLAAARGVEPQALAERTSENAARLCRLR